MPTKDEINAQLKTEYPLFFLEMNDMQSKFIRVKNNNGYTPKRRLAESGNKAGKCLTYNTLIETPNGEISIGELYRRGNPFDVYAWDGKKKVVARACAPFQKEGGHPCLRMTMDDGRWVETSEAHRVLTSKGWISSSDLHVAYLRSLQESSEEAYLSILPSGVLNLSERQSDFLERCSHDSRQYDEPLLSEVDNALNAVPLPNDVLRHSAYPSLDKDGLEHTHTNILSLLYDHLSTSLHGLARFLDRFFESLILAVCKVSPQSLDERLMLQRLSIAGDCQLQSYADIYQYLPQSDNASFSFCTSTKPYNKIVSFNPIPCQLVYDFTVPKYHNYFAGGLIHHNTQIGIAEDLAHCFGKRIWLKKSDPDYRVPIRIPNKGLIGCQTLAQSVMQKIWPTIKELIP